MSKLSPVRASRTVQPSTLPSRSSSLSGDEIVGNHSAMGVGIQQIFQRDALGAYIWAS